MAGFGFFLLVAVMFLWPWVASRNDERSKAIIRTWYARTYVPYFMRTALATAPVWALMYGALALVFVFPFEQLWIIVVLAAASFGLALVVAFLRPGALMPQWLKDEIDSGRVLLAVPHRADWVFFWMIVPMAVLTIFGIPWLNLRS